MDDVSWNEVDDLRGQLDAADRDRLDRQLGQLLSRPSDQQDAFLRELLARWRSHRRDTHDVGTYLGERPAHHVLHRRGITLSH